MVDNVLYLTELVGLRVFDLRGRPLGRVRDAAIVPLIDPVWVDRFLVGGGVLLLNSELTARLNGKAYVPDEPVLAVARGLYKLGLQRAARRK